MDYHLKILHHYMSDKVSLRKLKSIDLVRFPCIIVAFSLTMFFPYMQWVIYVFVAPDWFNVFVGLGKVIKHIAKHFGAGKIKKGDLIVCSIPRTIETCSDATAFPVNPKENIAQAYSDVNFIPAEYKDYYFMVKVEKIKPGQAVLALEEEQTRLKPMLNFWNPYKEETAKVKVLFGKQVFWVNPIFFKRVSQRKLNNSKNRFMQA